MNVIDTTKRSSRARKSDPPPAPAAPNTFALVIRQARERAGLTQAQLAQRAGVSQPCVAQWESGRRPIQEKTVAKVAAALGERVEDMLRRELGAMKRREDKGG